MDLRAYYRKVREVEAGITAPFVVIVSHETQDGGKPDVMTEVTRHVAARQIAEGRSRVATDKEAKAFHAFNIETKRAADDAVQASRVQLVVMPSAVHKDRASEA